MDLTKEAMASLNQSLHLPATGREQDWDIELADPDRIGEFADFLENQALDGGEKFALMALILASLDELAGQEAPLAAMWDKVKRLLQADPALYSDLVSQWAQRSGEDFAISHLLRSL